MTSMIEFDFEPFLREKMPALDARYFEITILMLDDLPSLHLLICVQNYCTQQIHMKTHNVNIVKLRYICIKLKQIDIYEIFIDITLILGQEVL
jgi:hypothetical protein